MKTYYLMKSQLFAILGRKGEQMNNEKVRLVSITPDAEKNIAYCARVSNPDNQDNPNSAALLSHCVRHGHWSIFEQANMVVEINTSRAIAPQILRHRSFSFQEFSQRYSAATTFVPQQGRRQAKSNRQSSIDDIDSVTQDWFLQSQGEIWKHAFRKY